MPDALLRREVKTLRRSKSICQNVTAIQVEIVQ